MMATLLKFTEYFFFKKEAKRNLAYFQLLLYKRYMDKRLKFDIGQRFRKLTVI